MRKFLRISLVCFIIAAVLAGLCLVRDWRTLKQDVIRLHVLADSDSLQDQQNKLRVRDDVMTYLSENMKEVSDSRQAKTYLLGELENIRQVAQQALKKTGSEDTVWVSLQKEHFDTRHYEDFSLPAGVYESLQIGIGRAEGRNWWCVVFPSLCIPAAAEDVKQEAVEAGLSQGLADTITKERGYEVRFFLFEVFGKLENFLYEILY